MRTLPVGVLTTRAPTTAARSAGDHVPPRGTSTTYALIISARRGGFRTARVPVARGTGARVPPGGAPSADTLIVFEWCGGFWTARGTVARRAGVGPPLGGVSTVRASIASVRRGGFRTVQAGVACGMGIRVLPGGASGSFAGTGFQVALVRGRADAAGAIVVAGGFGCPIGEILMSSPVAAVMVAVGVLPWWTAVGRAGAHAGGPGHGGSSWTMGACGHPVIWMDLGA
ncbi:hypothetical protein GCM10009678_82270 [Actinomadura kijaniata]